MVLHERLDMSSTSTKAVAYGRVSTLLGQDPELQLITIREFARNRGLELAQEYVDKGISGAKERRPALDRLIADAKQGRFNVLIVTGIDRIGRNTRHLLNLIHELSGYGVGLISLRENLDFTTPVGSATLIILGAIAELERELTRERIRTALAAKKLVAHQTGSGWRCGRPIKVNTDSVEQVLKLHREGLSVRKIEKAMGRAISRTTVHRILQTQNAGCPETVIEIHPAKVAK